MDTGTTGLRLRPASEPRLSPDGAWLAHTLTEIDTAAQRVASSVWLCHRGATPDGGRRQAAGGRDSSPCWVPDGRDLAFARARDGQYRLYRLSLDGDEP